MKVAPTTTLAALIAVGAATAAGERDRQAFILVEGEVTNSVTKERLGIGVRKIPGKKLLRDDKEKLTLEIVKSVIDDRAVNARLILDRVLK